MLDVACIFVDLWFYILYVGIHAVNNWFPGVEVLSSMHSFAGPFAQPQFPSNVTIHDLHAVFVFANHALLFQQDLQH